MQFEFLQREMRPKDIRTIDEMFERNFTLRIGPNEVYALNEMDFYAK